MSERRQEDSGVPTGPELKHPLPRRKVVDEKKRHNILEGSYIDYPEFASISSAAKWEAVIPDEFVGASSHKPVPNSVMPEASSPVSILGGELVVRAGNKFELFLSTLQQLCRNYNADLYKLRDVMFRQDHRFPPEAHIQEEFGKAKEMFDLSAERLADWLAQHDPEYHDGNKHFQRLAVEFVKINDYIASIRAGATEEVPGMGAEYVYSSSSHVSISSMFGSSQAP
jgi:hypothetical protein